ncbi:hypothetical protein CN138_36620 [Sinorhizobium meliloti]|nr:hypothetical protein SMRU11_06070 [Sinorhizobium meliloti RU11/001]RVG20048.1 hypothetical protein CN229_33930 [Sinorhizobium meliloti]RVG52060.1 hypothetical protein CN222_37780 [Sinorhizobium meliloti]RVH42101.1 hypothetical protein CN213_37065 [Sinorhizobium meliloti]RVH64700.1 hypothetical protein CN203_37290 [Sinorhizobium meliloti]
MQNSEVGVRALSERYDINQRRWAKWKKRTLSAVCRAKSLLIAEQPKAKSCKARQQQAAWRPSEGVRSCSSNWHCKA